MEDTVDPTARDHSGKNEARRRFCQVTIGGMATIAVGTVTYPLVTFLTLPRSSRPREVLQIALADIPVGTAIWGEHQGRQVVIVNKDGTLLAFNGACTHLGCIVHWDGGEHLFRCPCHGATFDAAGNPVSGPVNIPLHPIEFTIKDDMIVIA
jgi:Rieske Fe-S protein